MPSKRAMKNVRKMIEINEDELTPELITLRKNREYRFAEILGDEWPREEILLLVHSSIDYHSLQDLVNKGCDPSLALKILA